MSEQPALQLPTSEDLISQIQFAYEDGKIWLDEQRMLLIHSAVMGSLRKELVSSLGLERARGFLMRFGYQSGMKDAEFAHKIRPDISTADAFLVGPQMHCLKGMVRVDPIALEFDVEKGEFYGEFDWYDSYESEVHINEFGIAEEPICWTLLGYASGFTSYYMGRKIIFKETQCSGTGHDHCHIVGKPAEEWEDQEELERCLLPDPIVEELFALRYEISTLRENLIDMRVPTDSQLFNSVGQSPAFQHVCHLIQRASSSTVTVLLQGETGVGKEVVARGLHQTSERAEQPFIAVNCACIPPDLIEAELFGVRKGAYTGATQSREGKFERAHGGTIFLDEVVELSPRAQAALLRVLQEGEMERVGDNQLRKIDVRVVAATNEDLAEAVQKGKFRQDLFYRLNVYPVQIPPLRERLEDIPLLIEHFLEKYHNMYNKHTLGVSDKAMQALIKYKWPGNIRELENMIERGIILTDNNRSIDMKSFFPSLAEPSHPLNVASGTGELCTKSQTTSSGEDLVDQLLNENFDLNNFEQQLLDRAMQKASGNVTQAARLLGITRPQMAYRLKK
ncbi:sigma-54-dependent Fis family transcriptional regulator [Neptuniibacter sp.]|uniref:sigma-54-dependent Fis family transcriptional regulator n=1 Tax=Neptuniibacter sp. TaxID=1962643 RepID=UPI00261A0AA4|nr:sigma-54-dependent Fis family transcriptional regulator [Neptuniibacter sp.]MCP4597121.1 sigma-54-dependent Fis family transcriptional regulator [Neptuniibacter sp.]